MLSGVAALSWLLIRAQDAHGQTWEVTSTYLPSDSVACSQDGRTNYMVSGDGPTVLYKSSDDGASWARILFPSGGSVACSGDGLKAASGALISTNGGSSFVTNGLDTGFVFWSADGNILIRVGQGVAITTNDGDGWFYPPTMQTSGWQAAALSANGQTMLVAPLSSGAGPLRLSTNFGQTWADAPVTNRYWTALACTASGANIIAAVGEFRNTLVISHDAGKTWVYAVPQTVSQQSAYDSFACSADGSLTVATIDYHIYISCDFGSTWTDDNPPGTSGPVACSADGTFLVTTANGYVAVQHLPPLLNIAPAGAQIALSWPAPSSLYALQQIEDLSGTNWAAVTNAVTVTNYRNTLTLPAPATGNTFYRLNGPN